MLSSKLWGLFCGLDELLTVTQYAVIHGKMQLHFNAFLPKYEIYFNEHFINENVKSALYFVHKVLYNSISQYDGQRLQWNKLLNALTIQVTSLST